MNTEAFIAEVLARPAIWQSSHPKHKHIPAVNRLWEEIKIKFPDHEVVELKKKWKNLRDTYSKELKKIPKFRSGASPSYYEPSWKFFAHLGFLKAEYMPLPAEPNFKEEDNDISNENDPESLENNIKREVTSSPSPSPSPSSPNDPSTSITQNSNKKRPNIKDIRAEYLEIERKKLKILEKEMAKDDQDDSQRCAKKSDDYHFLMSILPEMEKLPPMQKLKLRNKINQALFDEIASTMGSEPYGRYEHSTCSRNQTN